MPASPADDRKRRPVQDPPETDVPRSTRKTEAKASPPSPADYAAFSRSIGRALSARGADQHTVEDITQESFARLLPILGRLGADARLPWLLVTANNLFTDQHRRASTARRNRSELIELNLQPAQPHQVFQMRQVTDAVRRVIDNLDQIDRSYFLSHADGVSVTDLAESVSTTPQALSARMYRTRARMRLDYLLAIDQVTLTDPLCRRVLLAFSAADRRKQKALGADDPLDRCSLCADLARRLIVRSSAAC